MYKTVEVEIEGITPTLMHNGQLADPLNKWTKAISAVTKKGKNKTEDDLMELARLEWMGSLYVDENGRPCWPGENVERMIRSGASATKQGKVVQAGIVCDGNFPLIFKDSKKSPEDLFQDESYRHSCLAKVGTGRVVRTRPIFRSWRLEFTVSYMPSVVKSQAEIKSWIETAGQVVGLSDWRPKYGKFRVLKFK